MKRQRPQARRPSLKRNVHPTVMKSLRARQRDPRLRVRREGNKGEQVTQKVVLGIHNLWAPQIMSTAEILGRGSSQLFALLGFYREKRAQNGEAGAAL